MAETLTKAPAKAWTSICQKSKETWWHTVIFWLLDMTWEPCSEPGELQRQHEESEWTISDSAEKSFSNDIPLSMTESTLQMSRICSESNVFLSWLFSHDRLEVSISETASAQLSCPVVGDTSSTLFFQESSVAHDGYNQLHQQETHQLHRPEIVSKSIPLTRKWLRLKFNTLPKRGWLSRTRLRTSTTIPKVVEVPQCWDGGQWRVSTSSNDF